jgi:hypothetical protein
MAINDNYDALTTYDRDQLLQSQRLNVTDEHAGQVVVFEMLRHLKAAYGEDVVAYNNMTEEQWTAHKAVVLNAASLHPNARIDLLTAGDLEVAYNMGGNYFEHGYVFILDGTQPADKVSFSKYG